MSSLKNSENTNFGEVEFIKCKQLFTNNKINGKILGFKGYHVLFQYGEHYCVCKRNEKELFDFIDFNEIENAREYLARQRDMYKHKVIEKKIERKREHTICIRTLFKNL